MNNYRVAQKKVSPYLFLNKLYKNVLMKFVLIGFESTST